MVKGMMERVKWKTWHTTTKKRPPNSAGQWSRRLKSGHVRGPRKVGWKSVEIYGGKWGPCHTIFQLLWLPWSPLLIFSPRNGNKRTTLTVCYPHLFGGLQFSFAWFFFTPVFIFFIYIVFGSLLPFFLVVPPSEHLLKLPDWQQRHFLNGSPGSCRMISGVHEGSARTSSRFHCLPAFLWVYPGN